MAKPVPDRVALGLGGDEPSKWGEMTPTGILVTGDWFNNRVEYSGG